MTRRRRDNPTLSIPIRGRRQLEHIHAAEDSLSKAGVEFDVGTGIRRGKAANRDWELDYSLTGAKIGNPDASGKRRGLHAEISIHTAWLSEEFGKNLAMRKFEATEEELAAIVGRYTKGKRKGLLRGQLCWSRVDKGGWYRPTGGVIAPRQTFGYHVVDPFTYDSRIGGPKILIPSYYRGKGLAGSENPIRRTRKGWYWGSRGPFPTRDKAMSVMRAAFASGYRGRNPLFASSANNLYESFHGSPPARQRKVYYDPPRGTLVKIGDLSEIRYKPTAPSRHAGTEFYHKSGDTGTQMLKTNLILATDAEGKNLYLVRKTKGGRPTFTDRGIIG